MVLYESKQILLDAICRGRGKSASKKKLEAFTLCKAALKGALVLGSRELLEKGANGS